MPKKKIIRNSDFPYHISARSNNREWFSIPISEVWKIFADYLYFISFAYRVEIHAFVLMSNHYHLLARTPEGNLDQAMLYLQRETSRWLARESGRINHVFGGPYHSSLIQDINHYNNVYKYILRNPIGVGLANKVEEYPYSSLRGLLGCEKLLFPTVGNLELFTKTEEFLSWLNLEYQEEEREVIQKGIRRKSFELSRSRKTGKLPHLAGFSP
ncbi:MAG: transposase [Bdellovibrionaceae bacterium]|nr:transposase [Pseudobdellovibrionaceae bacterium]